MRIALIDPCTEDRSPPGKCLRALMAGAGPEHEFTVFSPSFDAPPGARARFVRVFALPRPGVVRLPTLWLTSALAFLFRWLRGDRYDLVIGTDAWSPVGRTRYAHVCHGAYRAVAVDAPGLRGFVQRVNRSFQVTAERVVLSRADRVVAVSAGLADDLVRLYPRLEGKVVVVANFVDVAGHERPSAFDRDARRAELGFDPGDRVLVFVALGHFETKGLPELLQALRAVGDETPLRLLVVGGFPDRINRMRQDPDVVALGNRVRFVGFADDVRPYYWLADAFVLPTRYETFSFVAYEAAAAGLPLVATPVHGVREILTDGVTGWEVTPDPVSIAAALREVAAEPGDLLRARGDKARAAAAPYDRDRFTERWATVLSELR